MESPSQKRCRACGEIINPGDAFCNHCGAYLAAQGYAEDGHVRTTWVLWRVLKTLMAVLVPVAVLASIGYVIYHQLQPQTAALSGSTVTTRALARTTTSTTVSVREYTVLTGTDRYDTAIAISKQGFPRGTSVVVLAPGETYQEALCAAPLAGAYGGPLLLVPSKGLTDELLAEIERLRPSDVFLVGIQRVTSIKKALDGLVSAPSVTSLNGADQYETAALVARQLASKLQTISKVVVVPGDTFADGLAVAPLAASQGWPVLLASDSERLPRLIRTVLEELVPASALAVGTDVAIELDEIERILGADRYDTCVKVAEYGLGHGLKMDHVALATGLSFPDALAAGPYLALDDGVLLLTQGNEVPPSVASYLSKRGEDIKVMDFISLPDLASNMKE